MKAGPPEFYTCPFCGAFAKQMTLMSGNTFGARYWSDGFRDAPMLPELPLVAQCSVCSSFFWFQEATIQHAETLSKNAQRILPYAALLNGAQLQAALGSGAGNTTDRERYLRIHFWWAGNHKQRGRDYQARAAEVDENAHQNNIAALRTLVCEDEPNHRAMLAEIARQNGQFGEVERLIAVPFPEGYNSFLRLTRAATARKNSELFLLSYFGKSGRSLASVRRRGRP